MVADCWYATLLTCAAYATTATVGFGTQTRAKNYPTLQAGQARLVQRLRLGDVAVFENRQPVTAAKFITKCSLFILMLAVIRRPAILPNRMLAVRCLFL
jgi:hypothetical protein